MQQSQILPEIERCLIRMANAGFCGFGFGFKGTPPLHFSFRANTVLSRFGRLEVR